MGAVKQLEDSLAKVFKDLPALPDSSKEGLANVWPWLALIGGVVQLWAAWVLYDLTKIANGLAELANSLSVYYTGRAVGPSSSQKTVIYLGIIMLAVDAVILLMAFPKLQKRERGGWDLLFLGAVVNVAYGVLQIFTYQRGIASFIWSLLTSAVVFYLLFQVREKFGGKKAA